MGAAPESLAKTFNLWAWPRKLTSAAIVGFAWRRGYLFRIGQPHLTITHNVTHRQVSPEYTHIEVTATLHNRSRVKVEIQDGLFTIQQIAPAIGRHRTLSVSDDSYQDRYVMDEIPRVWNRDELAEPGES